MGLVPTNWNDMLTKRVSEATTACLIQYSVSFSFLTCFVVLN